MLRWRRDDSPYVMRSYPAGWSVAITLAAPRVPVPGPPRPGHGPTCPWVRVPGPPTARFDASRQPAAGAKDAEGRPLLSASLGCHLTVGQAIAACQADANAPTRDTATAASPRARQAAGETV
jgi:hypothetical protein